MKNKTEKIKLESKVAGTLPIINHFLAMLNLETIFYEYLPKEKNKGRKPKLSTEKILLILIRNILGSRVPLYKEQYWVREHIPELFTIKEADLRYLNDDRFGRALDILFKADRRKLNTQVILQAVRKFKVKLDQIHNDTTSVSFFGIYKGQDLLGTVLLARGYNKDHRPDLKQLVFSVSISADGDIPVDFHLFNGNTNDDQIHCEIWNDLREFIGKSDFIYIGDCKLCTLANMHHIDSRKGKFITVLPRTRKEDGDFRDWVQDNEIPWNEEKKLPNPRRKEGPPHIFKVFESPSRSKEGYRIIWVWDSLKAAHDAIVRKESLDDAQKALGDLKGKIGKRSYKTRGQVKNAVTKILFECKAAKYFNVHVDVEKIDHFKQARPGRPSDVTPYLCKPEEQVTLSWEENSGYIRWESKTDGLFPLITNIERDGSTNITSTENASDNEEENKEEFIPMKILEIYKYQPNVEKLHSILKSLLRVMPVWLKKVPRIEAILTLFFIALLVATLIQRQLRKQMQQNGIESLPLYPEERECKKPTTDTILNLFQNHRRHRLFLSNRLIRTFWDELSPLQKKVLDLLGVDQREYRSK